MYEDIPLFWDAWDVEVYHLEKGWAVGTQVKVEIVESGPLRAMLRVTKKLTETSSMIQCISMMADSQQLVFDTEIDWHENRKILVRKMIVFCCFNQTT
jgi:alpha-mannosidase